MNWDQIEGSWKDIKGRFREKWAKITDSDWDAIGGKKDRLLGALQKNYGYAKEDAEREADAFLRDFDTANQPRH
jgi:uncharacterized protein YjbJ (UPF0337 family)